VDRGKKEGFKSFSVRASKRSYEGESAKNASRSRFVFLSSFFDIGLCHPHTDERANPKSFVCKSYKQMVKNSLPAKQLGPTVRGEQDRHLKPLIAEPHIQQCNRIPFLLTCDSHNRLTGNLAKVYAKMTGVPVMKHGGCGPGIYAHNSRNRPLPSQGAQRTGRGYLYLDIRHI
jgi:hypothetical protein